MARDTKGYQGAWRRVVFVEVTGVLGWSCQQPNHSVVEGWLNEVWNIRIMKYFGMHRLNT